jgi:hypothetical protein
MNLRKLKIGDFFVIVNTGENYDICYSALLKKTGENTVISMSNGGEINSSIILDIPVIRVVLRKRIVAKS